MFNQYLLISLSFLKKQHAASFSNRKDLQNFKIGLQPEYLLDIGHLIQRGLSWFFKRYKYFDSSVSFFMRAVSEQLCRVIIHGPKCCVWYTKNRLFRVV